MCIKIYFLNLYDKVVYKIYKIVVHLNSLIIQMGNTSVFIQIIMHNNV